MALPSVLTSLPRTSLTWVGAFVAAFTVITAVVAATNALLLSAAGDSSGDSELPDGSGIRMAALLFAHTWTGHLGLAYEEDDGSVSGALVTPVSAALVVGVLALVLTTRLLTSRWRPATRRMMWAQLGTAVAGSVVVLLIMGLIGRFSEDETTISALSFGGLLRTIAILMCVAVAGVTAAAPRGGRLRVLTGDRVAERLSPFVPSLDAAATHVLAWSAVGLLGGLVATIVMADDVPWSISLSYLTAAIPAAALWGHLGGIGFSAKGDQDVFEILPSELDESFSWTLLTEESPAALWLLPLVAIAVVAIVAVRLTLLRPPGSSIRITHMASTAAALLISWMVLARLLGRVSFGFEGDQGFFGADAAFSAEPAWWSLIFLALTGVAIELTHGLAGVRLIQAMPQSWVRRIAPRPHPQWMPYLTGQPVAAVPTPSGSADAAVQGAGTVPVSGVFVSPGADFPAGDEDPTAVTATDDPTQLRLPSVGGTGAPVPDPTVAWGQPRPASRRTKLIAGGVLGALMLGLIAWVVIGQVAKRNFGPESVALDYASAVVEGRADDAVEVGRMNISNGHRQLLNDEVYGAAQKRPSAAEVIDVVESDDGESATVTVEFEQDGQRTTQLLTAERDGRRLLVFPKWRLAPVSPSQLSVTVFGDTAVVNGQNIELASAASPDDPHLAPLGTDSTVVPGYVLNLPALPGTYTVDLPDSKYSDATPASIAVATDPMSAEGEPDGSYGDGAMVSARPTTKFVEEVNKQIKSTIDGCLQDFAGKSPCPWDSSFADEEDMDTPSFTISEYPKWSPADDVTLRDGEGVNLDLSSKEIEETATCLTDDTWFCDKGESDDTTHYVSTSGWTAMLTNGKVKVTWSEPF